MNQERKRILLGFAGPIGVGKTTTADWFAENDNFLRLSLMAPLKEAASKLTGLPIEYFTNQELKNKQILGLPEEVTPRSFMQKMALEFVREMIYYDFFLWRIQNQLLKYSTRDIIIDDVRFDNEADLIRENGGTIVHLRREFDSPSDQTDHKSEKSLTVHDDDYVIHSEDTIKGTAKAISLIVLDRILINI